MLSHRQQLEKMAETWEQLAEVRRSVLLKEGKTRGGQRLLMWRPAAPQ
jgi:hypothetical protein